MEKFENLNELIIALLLWITSNTDYINPKQLPEVKFLEQNELSQLACKNDCEILAYTPVEPKYTVYLSKRLNPLKDVCHRGILLHEIIHVLQDDQGFFMNYDDRTKKTGKPFFFPLTSKYILLSLSTSNEYISGKDMCLKSLLFILRYY